MTTTLRTRLRGLAALAGLLLVLVGTPAVLTAIGATPFPDGIPTWDQVWATLTGVDDGTVVLTLLRLAAWGAWAYLALGVVLDLAWRARGIRVPRIRGLALSQSTAHALISAAVLAFTALPSLAAPASAAAPVAVTATLPDPAPTTQAALSPAAGGATTTTTTTAAMTVVVDAPEPVVHTVRPGETLWGIAEQHLGDGARFLQIAEVNYARPQPDGRTLTTSHRIHPGWRLLIPTTPDEAAPGVTPAAGVSEYTVAPGDTLWDIADDELDDPTRYGEIYTASVGIAQPGGHHLSDPDEISPGWTLHIPTDQPDLADVPDVAPAPAVPDVAPTPAVTAVAPPTADSAPQDVHAAGEVGDPAAVTLPDAARPGGSANESDAPIDDGPVTDIARGQDAVEDDATASPVEETWPVRTVGGVGSLLAAGLVGLLASHRALQSRRRRPGTVLPTPSGASVAIGAELTAVADAFGVAALDTALRTLSAACADAGRPLPVLRYARLAAGQVDLHLSEPAEALPPWTGAQGGTVWSLTVEDADLLDAEEAAGIPAPYPCLVTIGHDPTGAHVLLDLEHAASLALIGPEPLTRQVLAALAVELATSGWADDLQVTIVTAFPELEDALRTGRIRYLPAVGHLLTDLAERARADTHALAADGASDLHHARTHRAAPQTWTPEIVLLATPLTPTQHQQLAALVEDLPRVAVAVVTTGPGPGPGPWTLTLTEDPAHPADPDALLAPAGLRLKPQTLAPAGYRAILDILALTTTAPEAYPTGRAAADDDPNLTDPDQDADAEEAADDGESAATDHPGGTTTETGSDLRNRPIPQPRPQAIPQPTAEPALPPPDASTPTADPHPDPEAGPGGAGVSVVDGAVPGGEPAAVEADQETSEAVEGAGDERVPAPFIRVLGPVLIENVRAPVRDGDWRTAEELATFIALHPGSTQDVVQEALWPGSRASKTRYDVTSRLRRSLGEKAPDEPYLMRVGRGEGLRYSPDVRCDWDTWRDLLPDGPIGAPTENLEAALALVRGRPFENTPPRRYGWADTDRAIMTAQIADAAYELARRRAAAGDWRGAHEIAITGVAIDPALEPLWRVRILAAHATDPTRAGKDAIERMLTLTAQLGGDLEPQTTAMLTALRTGANPRDLLEDATTP